MGKLRIFDFFVSIQDNIFYWVKTSVMWSVMNITTLVVAYSYFLPEEASTTRVIAVFLLYSILMFVPSIQVLFILMRNMYAGKNRPRSVARAYVQLFTETYKDSFLAAFLYSSIWALVYINLALITNWHFISLAFLLFFTLVLIVSLMNYLLLYAHYDNTIKNSTINSFILTFTNPGYTLKVLLILVCFSIVSVFVPILFIFVVSMLVSLFVRLFAAIMLSKNEEKTSNHPNL